VVVQAANVVRTTTAFDTSFDRRGGPTAIHAPDEGEGACVGMELGDDGVRVRSRNRRTRSGGTSRRLHRGKSYIVPRGPLWTDRMSFTRNIAPLHGRHTTGPRALFTRRGSSIESSIDRIM